MFKAATTPIGQMENGMVGLMKWAKRMMRSSIRLEDPVERADRLIFIVNLGTLASPPFGATIVRRDLEHMAMEVFEYAAKWHGQGEA